MANTPHFPLPYLDPAQAGKEVTHNEALLIIDLLLHRRAVAIGGNPVNVTAPQVGQAWIVATGATGDWAGRDGALALFADGGWRFIPPTVGLMIWIESAGYWMRWNGAAWQNPPAAPVLSTNANQDEGARTALTQLTGAMAQWGLIIPAA